MAYLIEFPKSNEISNYEFSAPKYNEAKRFILTSEESSFPVTKNSAN